MGLVSEIQVDRDRCSHCGQELYQHFGGKRTREVLREYDGVLCIAFVVDVVCAVCLKVTSIDYMAEMLPVAPVHDFFAAVPTV